MLTLTSENVYLKTMTPSDVSDEYLGWLKDKDVTKFLEVRHNPPSKEEALSFVSRFDQQYSFMFAIMAKDKQKMIGTITLSKDRYNNTGVFGYLIGDRNYWGTKAGIEAVTLLLDYSFDVLNIRKIGGGVYLLNIGSIFNLKRLGFTQEGRIRSFGLIDGKEVDAIQFGILKSEWLAHKKGIK